MTSDQALLIYFDAAKGITSESSFNTREHLEDLWQQYIKALEAEDTFNKQQKTMVS